MTQEIRRIRRLASHCAMALCLLAAGFWYVQTVQNAGSVYAAGTCSNGLPSSYDGSESNSSAYSAKAVIFADGSVMCTPTKTGNLFLAWTMISASPSEYAQVGYIQNTVGTINYFIQASYTGGLSGTYNRQWGTPALGSSHTFAVQYNFSTLYFDFYVDGGQQGSTPWQPGVEWTGAYYPQYSGESKDSENDMPGNQYAPMQFTSMRAISSWNGTWAVPAGLYVEITGGNPNWRANLDPSTGVMGIYTYCPSNCGYSPSP